MRVSKAYNSFMAMVAINQRFTPGSSSAANAPHIGLFNGPMPTDAQLMALTTTVANAISWSATAIAPFATASNFLGDVMCASMPIAMDYDNNVIQLPFSAQQNLTTIATSGTPTWFMMRLAAAQALDTFAGFAAGGTGYVIIVGTVGDENSNADLKIVGGTVTAGQSVRASDMRIKF